MSAEDIIYVTWQMEQFELKKVEEALRQADSRRLVPHSNVKRLFRCPPNARIVLSCERAEESKISWSDAVVGELRSHCEYVDRLSDDSITREQILTPVFSTVEFICKHHDIGRSGRIRGTKEWDSGLGCPTIVYRELSGEIQVLGVLVSQRKWPHMKTASV